ncbi:uncharacterized protein [Drosophila virilis]|uniref:Mitochondrial splicing suppressor 51-like C-terminal domain-containing protein n=1 Tax=Drosophila virilis TaxID=7244 RepID=B4M8S2_DROVI|nr:uncharacterized protein LOC6634158 [Drosophila virilis]EDW57598.1 uncharacterized protein Dvir_GJ18181 [Drosophila virilis]
MSAINIDQVQYVSPLQCYICAINKASDLQNHQQLFLQQPQQHATDADANKQLAPTACDTPNIICRGCKMQRYCSLQHLVEDQAHRDFCRVLIELQKSQNIAHPLLLAGPLLGRAQLQQATAQLMLAVRVKLRRLLTRRECELIGYPGYCVVCYRLEPLTACVGCSGVAYCSAEHRRLDCCNHTPAVCRTLAFYYSPYRLLSSQLDIVQLKQRSDLKRSHLVETFYAATEIRIDSQPWRSLEQYERFAACSSFSGIASVCLALTNISFVAAPHEILSVYVVGAQELHRSYFQLMHLKFFFLQYPDVCQLEVYLIGHKLQPQTGEEVLTFMQGGCQRKVVLCTFPKTFERFVKTHRVDPVLIIIYNPDFAAMDTLTEGIVERKYPHAVQPSEQDDYSWHGCLLETLHTYGVPICFTSPTKLQARSDLNCVNALAKVHKIAIERVYNCTENPYREILPQHNPCPDDDETVIYANNYLEVVFTSIQC